MNIDTELNALQKIRRVDAPPFLLTRIEQQIAARSSAPVTPSFRFAVVFSLFVLAVLNGFVIISYNTRTADHSGLTLIAQQLNLSPSYDPYE